MDKTYDKKQLDVIDIDNGYHLVLAPPGCGKTDLLSERIYRAHCNGVDFKDMMCLTFTNRASKGMRDRIETRTGNPVPEELFVGNIHRYCSKFLFDNKVIPQNTAILDEFDTLSILINYMKHIPMESTDSDDDMERIDNLSYKQKIYLTQISKIHHLKQQIEAGHNVNILLYTEDELLVYCPEDIRWRVKEGFYESSTLIELFYELQTESSSNDYKPKIPADFDDFDEYLQYEARYLFRKLIKVADAYGRYKEENDMLDFDDLLIKTYDELINKSPEKEYHKYSWVQIDEVQDLNRLQFAITDALLTDNPTVVYLGDEQQAIFSFMGAKIETLNWLKERCNGNLHHLNKNYRSPKYLLDVFNTYAEKVLEIDKEFLPTANSNSPHEIQDLLLAKLQNNLQKDLIIKLAKKYSQLEDDCTTAILVTNNDYADTLSNMLKKDGIKHFKVSGRDVFSTRTIQTIIAHLTVIQSEIMFVSWAKLLYHLQIIPGYSKARDFMRQLKQNAIVPDDLFNEQESSYLLDFISTYSNGDIVLFDTETTGLDIYNDDIVQIAAIKIHNGEKVPGSDKVIYLKSEKQLPPIIAGKENPMIKAMKEAKEQNLVVERHIGLSDFMDYCKGCVLIAHNIKYDYNILDYNLKRDLNDINLESVCPLQFDTLKLIRLLEPRLKVYKLERLLEVLHLEGSNSHNAIDDVNATQNLLNYCYQKALDIEPRHKQCLQNPNTRDIATKLIERYGPLYQEGKQRLNNQESNDDVEPLLTKEFKLAYQYFTNLYITNQIINNKYVKKKELIPKEDKVTYITDYLSQDLIDKEKYHSLSQQLNAYSTDLLTLRESDLCSGASMTEKFFISTVYKAKGLEFDNVIVTDVVDDSYPFYENRYIYEKEKEDARKLYVAMSRAKKRLCLLWYTKKWVYSKIWNNWYEHDCYISPFTDEIIDYFDTWKQPDKTEEKQRGAD